MFLDKELGIFNFEKTGMTYTSTLQVPENMLEENQGLIFIILCAQHIME